MNTQLCVYKLNAVTRIILGYVYLRKLQKRIDGRKESNLLIKF